MGCQIPPKHFQSSSTAPAAAQSGIPTSPVSLGCSGWFVAFQAHPSAFIVPKHRNYTLQNQPLQPKGEPSSPGQHPPLKLAFRCSQLVLPGPIPSVPKPPGRIQTTEPPVSPGRIHGTRSRGKKGSKGKSHTKQGLFVPPAVQRPPEPVGRGEVVSVQGGPFQGVGWRLGLPGGGSISPQSASRGHAVGCAKGNSA